MGVPVSQLDVADFATIRHLMMVSTIAPPLYVLEMMFHLLL
jgi:hypothetical protein